MAWYAKVRREFKFSVLVPGGAATFPVSGAARRRRTVLLQGVIDCLIETAEGYVIVDFKTDRVSERTLPERAESYRAQLDAYAAAVREICGGTVQGSILYFFQTGTVWEMYKENVLRY